MTNIVYDEISEFFKSKKEDSDAIDAVKRLMYQTGQQFGKTSEAMRQSFHAFLPAADFIHNYIVSPAEMERQKRREQFYLYRSICMHGERTFRIRWSDEALASIGGHL